MILIPAKSGGFLNFVETKQPRIIRECNCLAYHLQVIEISLAMRQYILVLTVIFRISRQEKPRKAVSIAAWIKLDTNKGYHSIFDTVGGHSIHKNGQYHFEIQDGSVRWFHRNESGDQIFSVETGTCMMRK